MKTKKRNASSEAAAPRLYSFEEYVRLFSDKPKVSENADESFNKRFRREAANAIRDERAKAAKLADK